MIPTNKLNGLEEITRTYPVNIEFDYKDLNIDNFNDKIAGQIKKHLLAAKKYYIKKYGKYSNIKDQKFEELVIQHGGKKYIDNFKQNYYNKSLADFALNKQELLKIVETDDGFVQMMEPIFNKPYSPFGRAHFYAPVKKIGNSYIDTFWFNIIIIWLTTLIAYIILIYDLLKKLMDYIESLKLRKG